MRCNPRARSTSSSAWTVQNYVRALFSTMVLLMVLKHIPKIDDVSHSVWKRNDTIRRFCKCHDAFDKDFMAFRRVQALVPTWTLLFFFIFVCLFVFIIIVIILLFYYFIIILVIILILIHQRLPVQSPKRLVGINDGLLAKLSIVTLV